MDAQNATEADQSKPATAPRRRASDADSRRPPKVADRRSSASPETKSAKGVVEPQLDKPEAGETDADERDSDAETIVLPGKDGHSPSKIRKMKQEDKHDHDGGKSVKAPTGNGTDKPNADHKSMDGTKRRRLSASASVDKSQLTRTKDGSSGLSSAPASPPRENRALHRRRRSNASPHRSSDSEAAVGRGKLSHDRLKSGDRQPSAKRKALRTDSDDEDDHRKSRRQRTTSISHETARSHRERPTESRNRSNSPPTRLHRRSASTQLAPSSSGGLSQKKRRLPPPLQSTEHQSDESDRSGSPLPRSSKLRSLATPATADSNVSPAKIIPHKKHLDAHGQTFLARACARGEYDAVKKRLGERPEDINVADYAGNTPLQIAAINGCEDIVKLLIDAGCNMDCVNYDKDTPLLDAVDNGHLEVVKLLLDAGVNPRKANVSGQEPIDRITDETENADGIRTLLIEARKRAGERRRTSEDRHSHADYYDARDSHAPDSPRHSPAMAQAGATGRRSGTVRATKTRNDLLYMPLDDKTLRQAAGRGDEETVARILQVKEGCNDPESMVAAARGGHDLVIQLLLGLGSANPDPGPVPSLQPEFATPILAAIGQENIKVVELLLEQGGFDPTRRFKGETYYEIARKRQGTNWKEEENLLKNAYDEYKRAHKDGKPGKSPARRDREREREEKRSRRDDASRDETRTHKRSHSSPNREGDVRKKSSNRFSSPKERRKLESGRHIKEDKPSSTQTSDRETSPAASHKATKSKHRDADAAVSSDGEALKPRRKLVSKGELRGERDKHRRSSMASNASSLKEPSSPQDSRNDEATSDKTKMSEKYHDRTKALKREETKDSSAPGGDSHAKRHRSSVTPDGGNHWEKDEGTIPQKRRRIDADEQAKRPKAPTSPETRHSKLNASRDGSKASGKASRKSIEDETARDAKDSESKRDRVRKETGRLNASEPAVRVKSEEDDVQMPDVESVDASAVREQDKRKKRQAEQEGAKEDEERQRAAEAKREEEHKRQEAKKEEERKQIEAEERRKREEADEAKRREAAEKARLEKEEQRLQEEKRKKEEEEQERQRQEAERKRQEEEKKRLEEARKRREEEERARLEQLEREAAEAARRKREEDQRKERERRERAQREELERKRAAREAEQRRVREEQEKARLDKLPPLMRWLDLHPNPKTRAVAKRFSQVQGCRYDTIDSATNGTAEGREEWVLNTAVALLLGEKDLTLSRYSAWDHVPVSTLAKETLWRTEWRQYSLASQQYFDLGREVPGLYPKDPLELTAAEKEELKQSAWERFRDMPMFFVKVSELLYTVPHISHLNGVTIGVGYRELQEPETSSTGFRVVSKQFRYLAKHLSDPNMERYHGRAPRYRWYLNGSFVEEDLPKQAVTSHLPFNERPVPRRGLLAVNPNDPDYLKICREQGIAPLIKGQPSPTLTNGTREDSVRGGWSQKVNGINGSHGAVSSPEDQAKARQPLNGVNGIRQEISHEP